MIKAKKVFLAIALLATATVSQAALQEGIDYEVLPQPIPQLHPNKIEVLEFFSFMCPHCYHLEPILLKYTKTFPSDTYFRPEHVIWADSFKGLARITAAANASHTFYQVSPVIYQRIFNPNLKTVDEQNAWVDQAQKDLDNPNYLKNWAPIAKSKWGKAFLAAYDSPESQKGVEQMTTLTQKYKINATPTVIVGGKYRFRFKNFKTDMPRLGELIDMVRQERHMIKPKSHSVKAK